MSTAATQSTRSPLVKVVGASMVGTAVEWYDFFLYGSAAALVFPQLFFPESDRLVGTMLAFLTYGLGFVARPVGGLVFGHYGDKLGRKRLLVVSLLMMGIATFLIGLLPTYSSIGVGAPLLLVLLRLVQGFAVGGEWGGAVLIVSEHSSPERRGFWASWPQTGVPAGNLLATGVLALMAATLSDAAFESWGWRVAFLLSGVLVLIGLWVRLSVSESPLFLEAQAKSKEIAGTVAHRSPVLHVLRDYRREILTAMGARIAENISYYVITAFVLTYLKELGVDTAIALNALVIASAVHFLTIPLWATLSDRIGRRPVYLFGAVGTGLWAFAFFALLDTESFGPIALAVTVGLFLHGAMYGPQAAYFSEMFGTGVRYSGASIGYQLASIVAGAPAPLIAVALLAAYGSSTPISLYVFAAAVITVLAVAFSPETRHRDLAADPAVPGVPAQPAAMDTAGAR